MAPHPLFPHLAGGLLLLSFAVSPAAAQEAVRWRSGPALDVQQERDATAAALRDAARTGKRHVVLRLDGPITAATRQRLRAAGVEPLTSLGDGGWFAGVSAERFDLAGALATSALRGAYAVRPEWKLHPLIEGDAWPDWSVVDRSDPADPVVAIYVVFHPDVSLANQGTPLVAALAGRVMDTLETINGLVVELPRSSVARLADADAVQWIEPPLPPMSDVTVNDSARAIVQADAVQAGPYNLDGSGVTVMVYDGGTARASHVDFGGRLSTHDGSGQSDHATHVSGTIGGDGSASSGTWRGMAPAVDLVSYGLQTDGSGIFLYTNPGDIEADYGQAINTFGADVANNSIGTNTETNGFPCIIQGDYGVCSSVIDGVVTGSLGSPFRICWANGNERQGSGCDVEGFGDYYSTAPPATAKNHITCGALNSNNDSMTSFSSWGPTDDGRIKPDISGPGCQSNGDFGLTSPSSSGTTAYSVKCGTSMATPTVTGLVALLLEDYRAQFGGPDPLNSTVKALLAHNAVDRGNTGPDYQFGYGSVRIQDTIDHMRLGFFDEATIPTQGATYEYTVAVGGSDPELKVMLAWDDVPGTPNVFGSLVNDLDLRVFDPGGTRRYPWTLDPSNPGSAAVQTQEDHVNNIEQVLISSPTAGTWRVEVHGFDVPSGPQVFSITSSHGLTAGPFVQIGFPNGLPASVAPGVATTITADIDGIGEGLVGGSPTLHYRFDGGSFNALPMASVGGDTYEATLPAAFCADVPEFYVSASGATSGLTTNPIDAPASFFTVAVEDVTVVFTDDFQTDKGWTVTNVSLTDGPWDRGTPVGGGDRGDPLQDFDGSGACYLTDNVDGNSDVDGGPTRLTSPTFDLSGTGDYFIRYARWWSNDDFDVDALDVEISNNGGSNWTTVESNGNTFGWTVHSFKVSNFVAPTNNVVIRFNATDNPNDSVSEGAIDFFEVTEKKCDVNPVPSAEFVASAAMGQAPHSVNFTDLSSGTVDTWAWTFGDGGTSSAQHPSHQYDLPGTYTVELTASGPFGSDVETKVDYILASKPPLVGFTYGGSTPGSLGAPTLDAHSDLTPGAAFYIIGGNMPQGTTAFLALSANPKIPPADLSNGLLLNVNIPLLILTPVVANADGEAILQVAIPPVATGLSIYMQTFDLDGVSGDAYASSLGRQVNLP